MQIPDLAQWTASFDVNSATQAWLDTLSAAQRVRSDAYFEGGYWLLLWDLLWALGVAAVLLSERRSAHLRNWTERVTAHRGLQTLLFAAVYLVLVWLLTLPLSIYAGYFREHQYGLATQSFLPWFGERCIGLAVSIVLGSPFIALLYWLVRRAGNIWWAWATGLVAVFGLFVIVISPVFIEPLFNDYRPLPPGPRAIRSCPWLVPTAYRPMTFTCSTPPGRPRASAPTSPGRSALPALRSMTIC